MERIIMHIDVNNAFLSWTAIYLLRKGNKVDIRKTYAVIGNELSKRHAIVLSKSTPIKKLGVKTAEPIFLARKKCPSLKVYSPNFKWYKYMSNKMFELIKNYTPDIEIFSIDECFIDYTPIKHIYGDEVKFAYKLKNEIQTKLGFTVNIGVANNKLCAKMASDFTKPNRVHTLFKEEVDKKMKPLDVSELFFIGRKTTQKLKELNINTIYDLSKKNEEELYPYFKSQAHRMIESANGIDDSPLREKTPNKGISNSITTFHNLKSLEEIYEILQSMSENLTIKLRKEKRYAKVVRVQLKNANFKNYTHQTKLDNPTNNEEIIFEIAKKLVKNMWDEEPIRLVGLALDNITDELLYQPSIFEEENKNEVNDLLDSTLDQIKEKYGMGVISKASQKGKIRVRKKY